MLILTKKVFVFKGDGRWESQGHKIIEEAPEWIRKTWLFDLAVKDGDLVELKDTSDKKIEAQAEEPAKEEASGAKAKGARSKA